MARELPGNLPSHVKIVHFTEDGHFHFKAHKSKDGLVVAGGAAVVESVDVPESASESKPSKKKKAL